MDWIINGCLALVMHGLRNPPNQVEYGAGFGYLQKEQGTVPMRVIALDSRALLECLQYLQIKTRTTIRIACHD
jgi:hypothetical protein